MQAIVFGFGNGKDKEFDIISNVISRGYEKYKKDDIPLVITLGDENSTIADNNADANQSMEFGSYANSRFGDINANRTLGSDTFAISDTFIDLEDIDTIANEFLINQDKKELLAKEVYNIDSLNNYGHKSVKIYKSILINYCDKYKKSLTLALSRALGYTIAKDLTLGKYIMNEDDNITEFNPIACRTAIMIIASYYSWQIMEDSGASHRIRNVPDLDKSAKMAMQMFILGGLDKEDVDKGAVTRHLYLICNYVTLNYVNTGNKVDVKSMFSEGSVDYQKLSTSIRNSALREDKGYAEAIEVMYKKKLEIALPALENLVNVCINLVEKCKISSKLENVDIEPVDRLVKETEYQLTKTFENDKFEELRRRLSENSVSEENSHIKVVSKNIDDMRKIVDLVLSLSSTKSNLPVNVLNSKLNKNINNTDKSED